MADLMAGKAANSLLNQLVPLTMGHPTKGIPADADHWILAHDAILEMGSITTDNFFNPQDPVLSGALPVAINSNVTAVLGFADVFGVIDYKGDPGMVAYLAVLATDSTSGNFLDVPTLGSCLKVNGSPLNTSVVFDDTGYSEQCPAVVMIGVSMPSTPAAITFKCSRSGTWLSSYVIGYKGHPVFGAGAGINPAVQALIPGSRLNDPLVIGTGAIGSSEIGGFSQGILTLFE